MKDINMFCKVKFLNGSERVYQFPNDLRGAMLEEGPKAMRKMMKGRLINVPVSYYDRRGRVKISVAKITNVFTMSKRYSPHLRTRGQFIDLKENPSINFLLHDYSFVNKTRIRLQCAAWKFLDRKNSKKSEKGV